MKKFIRTRDVKFILSGILMLSLICNFFSINVSALDYERIPSLLKEVYPATTASVAGSDYLDVSATAYFGSKVTARLDGVTITLEADVETFTSDNYVTYVGKFKIPSSKKSNYTIGNIKFTASYANNSQSKYSGDITVLSIDSIAQDADTPNTPDDNVPDVDDDTQVDDPDVDDGDDNNNPFEPGSTDSSIKKPSQDKTPTFPNDAFTIIPTGAVKEVIEVTSEYADTYRYLKSDGYPNSVDYQLTKGTIDVVKAKRGDLIDLVSGHTIRLSDKQTKLYKSETISENRMASAYTYSNVDATFLSFRIGYKTPVTIDLNPYPSTSGVTKNVNPTQVIVNFPYMSEVTELTGDFKNSRIIKDYKWEKYTFSNSIKGYRLILNLTNAGAYFGAHTYYDDNGRLLIEFNNPPYGIGTKKPLQGIDIIVDPGHGGSDPGSIAVSKKYERVYNQEVAQLLIKKLKANGANVYTTPSSNAHVSLEDRVKSIYQYKPDLFISCHHNASTNKAANGFEVYYNSPMSQSLGQAVEAEFSKIMNSRGNKYYNFYVTRNKQVPSILIEHFFITNSGDEKKYGTKAHQEKMAEATLQGVINYYTNAMK